MTEELVQWDSPAGQEYHRAGYQNFHIHYGTEEEENIVVVLDQMITDEQILDATTADVLAGTQLDQPGVPGVFTVWLASTVVDSTVTIRLGGRTIVQDGVIVLRASSEIRENEDPFFQMISRGAGRPVISITEVTAMSCRVRTRFIPAIRT